MTQDAWRPLGIDTEEDEASYDALHDGVPDWMAAPYWHWVRKAICAWHESQYETGGWDVLKVELVEQLAQTLRIKIPDLRRNNGAERDTEDQVQLALVVLRSHPSPLQVADYLIAHDPKSRPSGLDEILARSKSLWKVGTRSGKPGLVRRVPEGVKVASDSIMARSGRAGARLAKAWELLYGLVPNPSEAYRCAILAVEDAAVPRVSPKNDSATLGTVLKQMEDQSDWALPMAREHKNAPTSGLLVGMMRALWHGQHDRHGGQPIAPGDVSFEEAQVAVSLAVALVHWFEAGLVDRESTTTP